MSNLEDRLRSWFAAEVNRAEQDLATSQVRTARVHRRGPLPGLALVGLTVVVVAVAVALRPGSTPGYRKWPARQPDRPSGRID